MMNALSIMTDLVWMGNILLPRWFVFAAIGLMALVSGFAIAFFRETSALLFFLGCAIFVTSPAWLAAIYVLTHQPARPTPDQLYGCTVAQQAQNGECK
ncbi:hypothetical protein ACRQ5Q_16835 [Bradyrhizobium sp. PMVTL-01]|uniref:hypothetical protein n=1 Tax=Bradyrhizobium sp. PMVTL-01 TaxID=3434999 RepID=UPI003F7095A8